VLWRATFASLVLPTCCAVLCFVQDVSLKLLLDAARGLAYMHDVDVVHGDVKSRNLLVFWEEDDEGQEEQQQDEQQPDAAAGDTAAAPEGLAAATAAAAAEAGRSSSPRPPVWGLKWCDFGVSFRAAEAPNGIMKTVRAGFWEDAVASVVASVLL